MLLSIRRVALIRYFSPPALDHRDFSRESCLLTQETDRSESSGAPVLMQNSAALVTVHNHI